MTLAISSLDPQELVVFLIAIGGLLSILLYRRRLTFWLLLPYAFLVVGAIATNAENLLWHDTFNFVEHAVGNLGAGLAFALFAYLYSRRISDTDPAGGR